MVQVTFIAWKQEPALGRGDLRPLGLSLPKEADNEAAGVGAEVRHLCMAGCNATQLTHWVGSCVQ